MKTTSRILALVLTLALALSLVVSVSAATTYTVDIDDTVSGYTYTAYKIFSGDLDTTGEKLSNITWGSGITDAGKEALYTQLGLTDSADKTAAKVAEKLSAYANKSDEIKAISDIIGANLGTAAATDDYSDSAYQFTGLEAGYYFFQNTVVPSTGDMKSYTDFILEVVKDHTGVNAIEPKRGTSTVTKEVKDVNDSTDDDPVWGTSADHDIADEVEFKLTGTLADNYADYKDYYYSFEDTMAHLTYVDGSVQVTVGTTDITSWFTTTWNSTDKKLTINCADLKAKDTADDSVALTSTSTIVVTYKATLDSDAVIGVKGNVNSVDLTYSNNPNATGDGNTTKTPKETTTVFTFQLDVDKIAKTTSPAGYAALTGAGFTLYKYDNSSSAFVAVGSEVAGVTSFAWKGIDAGTYKLVETTVPDGYNKMDDITFDVEATHDVNSVTALTVTADTGLIASPAGSTTTPLKVDDSTKTIAAGHIFGEIENKEGSTLPSTGGAGTTMLYVVGGILVVFAGVFLILRKRMEKAEK